MSKHLEDFVKNNREEFDKFEPGPVVWHNIQQQLKKPAKRQGIMVSMKFIRWSAAAAILLLVGSGTWYLLRRPTVQNERQLASNTEQQPAQTVTRQPLTAQDTEAKTAAQPGQVLPGKTTTDTPLAETARQEENEELVHYTRLVELKQKQIKRIQKEEPLLYRQFAGDFNRLDSTFHILKKQLPVNPNREQILEAMIQNLQYQEALLNQQLNIIKKINHSKKEAYEKAYRSI